MKIPTMKCILLGILICLNYVAHAQNSGSALLNKAVPCLAAKGFLPPSKTTTLMFGYLLDEKSYPGETMLYVVNYPNPSRSNGIIFTIFLTENDGRQNFNIQNNARFTLFKRSNQNISFVTPPLGGAWIQEHLVSAIKQIGKQPRFTISVKDMLMVDPAISCEAYTDSQPQPNAK